MRALIEFIMRGRPHACGVALAGYLMPLVSPSTVGLVALKKGPIEGSVVALWAMLPVLLGWFASDPEAVSANRLLILVSAASLFVSVLGAQVLRLTVSWQWSLVMLVVVGILVVATLGLFMPEGVAQLITIFMRLLSVAEVKIDTEMLDQQSFVLGLLAWGLVSTAVASLMISRWCQALVYNPGGFALEFQLLRLKMSVAQGSVVVIALGMAVYGEHALWFQLFSVPLLLAGIALVHHSVNALQLPLGYLGLMYLGLTMFSPVFALLLVFLAVIDSHIDLRVKLATLIDSRPPV